MATMSSVWLLTISVKWYNFILGLFFFFPQLDSPQTSAQFKNQMFWGKCLARFLTTSSKIVLFLKIITICTCIWTIKGCQREKKICISIYLSLYRYRYVYAHYTHTCTLIYTCICLFFPILVIFMMKACLYIASSSKCFYI